MLHRISDADDRLGTWRVFLVVFLVMLSQGPSLYAGEKPGKVNVAPEGFISLFNGRDLTGWRVHPKVKDMWSVENGVLKANGPLTQWVPDIETVKTYRDFVLLIDYRMATISDSGVFIRGLVPVLGIGRREQIDLGSGRMGHPLSFHYLTPEIRLEKNEYPRVEHVRPKIGVWHTLKVTLVGKTLSIEVDGKMILREFEYPEGMLSMKPSAIGLQKHVRGKMNGKMSDMPIEFRNIFIKELKSPRLAHSRRLNVPPKGFTALFNGKNFTGWRLSPMVRDAWSIKDGILKSHTAIKDWGADLRTVKKYRDYVLMVEYRIPTISDSGIYIRGLMPGIGIFDRDRWEQFNLRSGGGTGTLESFRFQPPERRVAPPRVRPIDPEVGVWHTVKLTLVGRTLSAEYDGETIIDRYEYAEGILSMEPSVIRLQKHPPSEIGGEVSDCPIEFRNIFIREIKPSGFPKEIKRPELNVPPRGFTALFNGKDFTGWRSTPKVKEAWTIEDGVLKAHHEIKAWGADLTTEKNYRDFVLRVDFRFPSVSDSGIWFRGVPGIMGGMEQFNLMSVNGTGNLDSLDHLPRDVQLLFRKSAFTPFFYCQPDYYRLKAPPVRYTDPEVGAWHTVKLTLIGNTLSAELDGHVIHDRFQYPEGTISMKPAPIRLQKHVPQQIAGKLYKKCPIEFRNIFIKEIGRSESAEADESKGHLAKLFARIDKNNLPEAYNPGKHQDYVDRRMAKLSDTQRAKIGQLWKEKQRISPDMPNRGASFVKILEYVAANVVPSAAADRSQKPKQRAKRPNVIVLLSDDLGSQDLGCYGGPVKTPTLDSLAARGVRFTDFHAGAAICSPSRATLLTGRQHLRTGIYGVLQDHLHKAHLLEREVTIAEVLQQSGYSTAHFGKWHIGMTWSKRKKPSPTKHGFDYWFGLSNGAHPSHKDPVNFLRNGRPVGPLKGYSCQLLVDDAIRWLDGRGNPDQPFFLNVWFNEPHHPLAAPDKIVSQYGDLKDEAAIYSATIDNTDRAIGRLVAKLKKMGQLDNTLIVYSSDNGSYRADRNGGLRGNKGSNFEGGLRSPGIFFWPGGFAGRRVESTPSGSVDLLPTICGLAGIQKPPGVHLDGADLSPLLTKQGKFKRTQPLFWLTPTSGHLGTLREGRYTLTGYRGYDLPEDHAKRDKLLQRMALLAGIDKDAPNLRGRVGNTTFTSPEFRQLHGELVKLTTFKESWIPIIKSGGFSDFALYDLKVDPKQTQNISRQQPEITARLKKKLLALHKSVMADAPDWSAPRPH